MESIKYLCYNCILINVLLFILVDQVESKLIDKSKDNNLSQLESTVKLHVKFVAARQPYGEVQPKLPHPGVLTYHNNKHNKTLSHGKHNKTSKYGKTVVTTLRPRESRPVVTTMRPKNKTSPHHVRPTPLILTTIKPSRKPKPPVITTSRPRPSRPVITTVKSKNKTLNSNVMTTGTILTTIKPHYKPKPPVMTTIKPKPTNVTPAQLLMTTIKPIGWIVPPTRPVSTTMKPKSTPGKLPQVTPTFPVPTTMKPKPTHKPFHVNVTTRRSVSTAKPKTPSTTKHRTLPHTQSKLTPMIVHMASNNTPAPLYHFSPIYKTNSKYQPKGDTLLTTIDSLLRNQLWQLQFQKDRKGIDYTKNNYFEVHHYYNQNQQNRVSDQVFKGSASATKCSNKTLSELLCVPNTYAVCLTNGFVLCVTHLRNTSSCDFNVAESCVVTRLPCIGEDAGCLKYISQDYVFSVPCTGFVRIVSNIVYNDVPTQGSSDFYRNHIDIENNYCVTTVAEPKQLQSGVGSYMRLLGEMGKSNWNVLKNVKIT